MSDHDQDDKHIDELAKYFTYLDVLRESGTTNMFGSPRSLSEDMGIPYDGALVIFRNWKDTYDGVSTAVQRARQALSLADSAS
jgi:hypothetical protein